MKSVTDFLVGYVEEEDISGVFIVNFFLEVNRLAKDFVLKSQQSVSNDMKVPKLEPAETVASFQVPMRPRNATPEFQVRWSSTSKTP